MRNIFDQYSQPENRLTHALASALAEDQELKSRFVKWVTKAACPPDLEIVEQSIPGELADDAESRVAEGLPDAWLFNEDGYSLLIESKVSSPISVDQLNRHVRTARQRGFDPVTMLTIALHKPDSDFPKDYLSLTWVEVYQWLQQQSATSEWAERVVNYMEVAEEKWPVDKYLLEGSLTAFSGVPFNTDTPYTYLQGKRILKLLKAELAGNAKLKRQLGIVEDSGRGKITGKRRVGVWDYFALGDIAPDKKHTSAPHVTLSITARATQAILLLPNGLDTQYKKNLRDMGLEGFLSALIKINGKAAKVLNAYPGAWPKFRIEQRHYPTRSSAPIVDGEMQVDLRTIIGDGKIKQQPQWIATAYDLLTSNKANIEVAVGVEFPYDRCKGLDTPKFKNAIAESWLACKPLIDALVD